MGIFKRISVLLLSALLTVGSTATVALAAPPEGKGQPGATEPKDTGQPQDADGNNNANNWGSVAAQLADERVMGTHSSDPVLTTSTTGCFGENREHNCRETPRDGLGNVARNDSMDHDVEGRCSDGQTSEDNCDSGGHLSDHGCVAAAEPLPGFEPEVQPVCTLDPQEVHGPEPEPES